MEAAVRAITLEVKVGLELRLGNGIQDLRVVTAPPFSGFPPC